MYELLDSISSPSDIRGFSIQQLKQLCSEIRDCIINTCAEHPGHLASSLGAVELIVGVHYVFDTPEDKFVFDVGHQAYAHKLLTGRRNAFGTLRCEGGIGGFPRRDESEYDCFGAGHSSTSISAALGFAQAAKIQHLHRKAIALIGDGAMTGGLAFEGLNNAGASRADLLVLLNDNNQSIDDNIGAMHEYLLKISTSSSYNRFKARVWDFLGDHGFRHFLQRWVRSLKSWFVKKSGGDLFESLGFRYFGPIDGNDIEDVVDTLQKLKDIGGPRILHCLTVKGKGFAPAEADPVVWHAPGKFNAATGELLPSPHLKARYQDVFGKVLLDLAGMDPKVVGVTGTVLRCRDRGRARGDILGRARGRRAQTVLQHLLFLRPEGIRPDSARCRPSEAARCAVPGQGGAGGRGRRHAPRCARHSGIPLRAGHRHKRPERREGTKDAHEHRLETDRRSFYNKVSEGDG